MRHASLFSGIGGFDLAARWMGWENVMQCEIDPFCQKVLRYHFPSAQLYGDIRTINGNDWEGKIDILTGGFPCQPFSAAGRRRGTEDNRFLWPEMLRIIRESEPTWIVAENVRGILSIEEGLVFERVCTDLEEAGYEVQPFCIPACAIGAPHRRDRVWFIAHSKSIGTRGGSRTVRGENGGQDDERISNSLESDKEPTPSTFAHFGQHSAEFVANATSPRQRPEQALPRKGQESSRHINANRWSERWLEAAARLCRVDDGLPRELDGITVPKWRKESLKSYGNAIVPQVAYQIFKSIVHE